VKRPDVDPGDAYLAGLRLLSARELSERQLQQRLRRRGFTDDAIAAALERLKSGGALDDRRTAFAFARTALRVKRHGRERVLRELEAIGVTRDLAREAVADAFSGADEAEMIRAAIARRRRGKGPLQPSELRRLHGWLLRQGFGAAAVASALRARGEASDTDD
jgi:regulatory protein